MLTTQVLANITGVGARSPLGLGAREVALGARAGKLEPRPTAFRDKRENLIGAARALALPDDLHGFDRMVALAAPALREAAQPLVDAALAASEQRSQATSPAAPPVVIAAPEVGRPGDDPRFESMLVEAIAEASGVRVDRARSEVVRRGHAGFGLALERALELLREPGTPAVLVGGVDSYFHPQTLAWLDAECRLHAPGAANGFVPSEGAAFLLLEAADRDRDRDRARAALPLGRVRAVKSALEETVTTEEPNTARAMTELVSAVAAASTEPVRWVMTDLNGERHRVREWSMVHIRSVGLFAEDARQDRWAEEMGDAGAAMGALLAVLACIAWKVGFAPARSTLIALHADGPERSALLLEEGLVPLQQTALSQALAERTTAPEQRIETRSHLRASRGEPSLHAFERAPILALDGFAGLDGRERRFSLVRVASEEEQVRRLARDCMEDIALLGDLRRRGENEPWTAIARFEQRLLDNLDALAALACGRAGGGVVEQLQRYATETSFPDRGRAFALAFVLACLEGDDAIDAAVTALRRADPSTLDAYQTALSLGSSPTIGPTMERLLWSEKPALMRIALEVLRRRGEASPAVVALLLEHPDSRVVVAAARAAGAMTEDRETITALLEPRLDDPDDEIAIAVAEALLVLGSPEGLSGLRARLRDEADAPGLMPRPSHARATRLLALGGGPEDLALLLAVINGDPLAAEALGWFGHAGAIDPLLEMLERAGATAGEHARRAQLGPARALHRITGAGLREAGASVEALDDRLVLDAGSWRAIQEERRRAPAPFERLRFGSPCTVMATVDELLRDESSPAARRDAALELALAIGPAPRIEVDGWAVRQQATLEALREHLGATPSTQGAPGEWPANRLARRAAAARR